MSLPKWSGLAIAGAVLCVLVGTSNGCSSSTNNGPMGDAAADGPLVRHPDGSTTIGKDDGGAVADGGVGSATYDMTTGKACKTSNDCLGTAANAPGINVCSNSSMYVYSVVGVTVTLFPTPVCELPPPSANGNCDPCGGATPCSGIHFCDGPDDPSSPGLCLPNDFLKPTVNMGVCVPYCTLASDGSAPVGCTGNNRCHPWQLVLNSANGAAPTISGYGFCQGGCEKDADCSGLGVADGSTAGYVCQTDIGFCTKTPVTRKKPIGTACTGGSALTSDTVTGACLCLSNTTTNAGYCTSECIVGGAPCPTGYVCDTGIPGGPLVFTSSDGGMLTEPAITKQNVGLSGVCVASCTTVVDAGASMAGDSGAGADAGSGSGQCPPSSLCVGDTVAGPDCWP
jgi:hypothetical protein